MRLDEAAVLGRLLARHSPSGNETAAVAEFGRIARRLGYRTRVDRAGNGIATRGTTGPEIMFLGHIDTVEGARPPRRVAGRIHGRGAVDAKGPLACALVAGSRVRGPGRLRIVAAVREETDSAGARYLLRGRRPDAVIVGEPSGWQGVTLAYKGDLRLELTFARSRSHWSSPTPTAADEAIRWLERARTAFAPWVSESAYRSLSMKAVGFHEDPSADPDVARVTVDIRLPPGLSTRDVLGLLPCEPPPSGRTTLARIEPVELPRTDPVGRALVRGVRAAGGAPTLLRKAGTSDLNVVVPYWKLPGAAYGPGDSRLDHTDHESVTIDELGKGVEVLERALAELGSGGGLTLPGSAAVP